MISKVTPDKQKALALKKMAEITLQRLQETDITKYPSNTLTDYYDTIHKLLEALTISQGVKFKGEGSHQELIDYVAKVHGLDEQTRQFLQQTREFRNKISYEGFMINKNYIILNKERINELIKKLQQILK